MSTTNTLLAKLGNSMEDPESSKFTVAMKLLALNRALKKVCLFIDPEYLSSLQTTSAATALTDYQYLFTALSPAPLNGRMGIRAVQDETAGGAPQEFLKPTTLEQQKRLENTLLVASGTNKVFFIWGNYIICDYGGGATDNIYIHYLATPTALTSGSTPNISTNLEGILLDFAESFLWANDGNLKRRHAALKRGIETTKRLNEEKRAIKGIGTSGRGR
jgi:hypothetical protein